MSDIASRRAFLDAVSPSGALIGCGPKKYKTVVLPDPEIVNELAEIGAELIGTNDHDGKPCAIADKIGEDDQRPGGCDNHVLTISP